MSSSSPITIHTDGSCIGNPGPGGWAAVLTGRKAPKLLSGGAPATTNNRMELTAAVEALRALSRPSQVEIISDSEYLVLSARDRLDEWRERGFINVKNTDLWRQLIVEMERHEITWTWTRAHSGNHFNEMADRLAKEEAWKQARQLEQCR
ncbi:ribonuclease HI [Zhengella sp. ZM62]|uniref:ribonuclease HI n=1 Tax=Zhengella sedimenti TaxID=3390035 RepID=UPI003975CB4B